MKLSRKEFERLTLDRYDAIGEPVIAAKLRQACPLLACKDGGDGFVHAQPRFERSSIGGYSTRVD